LAEPETVHIHEFRRDANARPESKEGRNTGTNATPRGGGEVHGGWVERFKRFRDTRHLKPIMALMMYMLIPLLGFQLIMMQYPDLDQTRFRNATVYIIPISIMITSICLVQEKFPKGNRFRLFLDAIYVMLTLLWLISLIGGSTLIRSSYEGHPFIIDVTPLVALACAVAALNFLHDVLESRYYAAKAASPAAPPAIPVQVPDIPTVISGSKPPVIDVPLALFNSPVPASGAYAKEQQMPSWTPVPMAIASLSEEGSREPSSQPIITLNDVLGPSEPATREAPRVVRRSPWKLVYHTPGTLFEGTASPPPKPETTSPATLFDGTTAGQKRPEAPAPKSDSLPLATVSTTFLLDGSESGYDAVCPPAGPGIRPTSEVSFSLVSEWSALLPHYSNADPLPVVTARISEKKGNEE
jgi:hypothetical protein